MMTTILSPTIIQATGVIIVGGVLIQVVLMLASSLRRFAYEDEREKVALENLRTAHSDKRRVLLARDAGVTEFLAKPFTPHALYTHIASIVEHPRSYIQCDAFFGPDRRRKSQDYPREDRRVSDPEKATEANSQDQKGSSPDG